MTESTESLFTDDLAGDLARIRTDRRARIEALFANERDWAFSPFDGLDPREPSAQAVARELSLLDRARQLLGRSGGDASARDPAEVERVHRELKYFPVCFVSAPHVESDVNASFPGEPTPLLYALAILTRYLQIDEFPAQRVPAITAIFNPAEYNAAFETRLTEHLRSHQPRVIGISNVSESHHFALRIAKLAKTIVPGILVILGGSHQDGTNVEAYRRTVERLHSPQTTRHPGVPRANPEQFDMSPEELRKLEAMRTYARAEERELVDFVVSGDAQYVLFELMKLIADHLDEDRVAIKSAVLARRAELGQTMGSGDLFFFHPPTDRIEGIQLSGVPIDTDRQPFILRRLISYENRYAIFGNDLTAQVMACLGCKYSCSFCYESADQVLYAVPKLQARSAAHVVKELDLLKEQGYQAVFFDDSTFSQDPRSLDALLDEIGKRNALEGGFLEWGCQTSINDVNPDMLRKMATAGCTYIYFGVEQSDPATKEVQKARQLRVVGKGRTWSQRFMDVARMCHEAGIRVGMSLQFGLGESEADRRATVDLAADAVAMGWVARNCVALNINTPYPGTRQWLEMTKSEEALPDYRERLKRHPRFETAHQFARLPFATADEIYAYARSRLGCAIVGVAHSNADIAATLGHYTHAWTRDFYVDDEIYRPYLAGERPAAHFNAASIATPFASARRAAAAMFDDEQRTSPERKRELVAAARRRAAALVQLGDERGVAFARNTTEAVSLAYWLAGLKPGDRVVLTNVENKSVQRVFDLHLDHGNPYRDDGWCSWPTWYSQRGPRYRRTLVDKTGLELVSVDAAAGDEATLRRQITERVDGRTAMLVLSHVSRLSGWELPVRSLCDLARQVKRAKAPDAPPLFILVDGAQALGNVPQVVFAELGCDAYVATPHKTMKSEVLGLLFFDPANPFVARNLPRFQYLYYLDQQVLLDHMFDPRLGVEPNVDDALSLADLTGFSEAVRELERRGLSGSDFSAIARHRDGLRRRVIAGVHALSAELGVEIVVPEVARPTSFILELRIPGVDGRACAQDLARRGVFLSFIEQGGRGAFRISFQVDNTAEEVDLLIEALRAHLTQGSWLRSTGTV